MSQWGLGLIREVTESLRLAQSWDEWTVLGHLPSTLLRA